MILLVSFPGLLNKHLASGDNDMITDQLDTCQKRGQGDTDGEILIRQVSSAWAGQQLFPSASAASCPIQPIPEGTERDHAVKRGSLVALCSLAEMWL